MKEELISFKIAKLAKEKGFNEPVQSFWHYFNNGENPERFDGPYHMIDDKLYVYDIKEEYKDNLSIYNITIDDNERSTFYLAPTQSLLQKYLREVKNIYIQVEFYSCKEFGDRFYWEIINRNVLDEYGNASHFNLCEYNEKGDIIYEPSYNTYEEALEVGLLEALKLIQI